MVRTPKVYQVYVTDANWHVCDFKTDYDRSGKFVQLANYSETEDVYVRLNEDDEAVLTLPALSVWQFTSTQITLNSVELALTSSGGTSAYCEVLVTY